MKFIVKNTSKENLTSFIRKAGYYFLKEKGSELSFIRPLERSGYPRFHIYVETNKRSEEIINIHLDQKKSVYNEAHDHAAEYNGVIIENEVKRIKQALE